METLTEIASVIARHVSMDGFQATPIERMTLVRSSTVTMPMPNVYRPQLCLVAQGHKEVTLRDRVLKYAPGRYGVVTYDLPATGRVVDATPDKPYLCLYLDFDPVMLADLALRVPPLPEAPSPPVGKTVSDAGAALLDAALRLLRLLDNPAALPVLGPLAEQEILYHLLAGPDGARMRHITASQGRVAQVGRAIAWLGKHFRERFSIDRLAAEAGMSPSSLHEHFRAVTAMTPLQFQKQLRLQQARSLMLVHDIDVTTAAIRVGYESPSQFSREYRRHFGESPARDITRLRASADSARIT
ncbi:AraC family transcriptional regulator [Burkholderia orbicola]|uniref:AraC family transcriptional regulator n=2 Tax=Burkholderia cepacia complex TaxID=87882 RepID=A0A427NMQ1_9BURK|nr:MULTISPECIES: AraC family transcriptional regulator [Burkholderia cepacia complex]AQQ30450.1 AraC family transcriptional regulator [Burkholderia cenocepacia]AQT53052.1 AraC family transcriptional regulator [Burkholderia cenocepacia]MBR8507298.1 AraC family transcriptional regulator [Burkholderia cenocepacia]MDN7524713.1 AraC family transcriptional regulator [Burkholderia orbicola]MDN7989073.1 AraC family transcriptional regulator [Burkholderia orbicola]